VLCPSSSSLWVQSSFPFCLSSSVLFPGSCLFHSMTNPPLSTPVYTGVLILLHLLTWQTSSNSRL
jgi:hypothetical protein